MIENPRDENGKDICFPGAPAPDPLWPERLLAHYIGMLGESAGMVAYARLRCGTLAKEAPEWYGHFLTDFDAERERRGIKKPEPFTERATDPALTLRTGRRVELNRKWSPT